MIAYNIPTYVVIVSTIDLCRNNMVKNVNLPDADASGDWKVWASYTERGQAGTEAGYVRTALGLPCKVMKKL